MLQISRRLSSSVQGRSFDAVVVGGGHNGLIAVSEVSIKIFSDTSQ